MLKKRFVVLQRTSLMSCTVAAILLLPLLGSSLMAGKPKTWQGKKISKPNPEYIMSEVREKFAEGHYEVILAKGGPTSHWVWHKLRGKHEGFSGHSHYVVLPTLVGPSGYTLWTGDLHELKVEEDAAAGVRRKERWGVYTLPKDLELEGAKVEVLEKKRKKNSVLDEIKEDVIPSLTKKWGVARDHVQEFVKGRLSREAMLRLIHEAQK